jgi:hypothetical protein
MAAADGTSAEVLMPARRVRRLPVIPPEPDEARALRGAARYLRRAGTRAATDLLDPRRASDLPLRHAIRDNLLAAAELCDSLVDMHEPEPDRGES